MSGGYIGYELHRLEVIASMIDELIDTNDERLNRPPWPWRGIQQGYGFTPETIARFREASHTIRRAHEMARRVDWLVSGDDSEDAFHRRWEAEVRAPYE